MRYEQQLVQIWETLFGSSPIGVQDDFFEVGGDSLNSVSLMLQIEQKFGKTLPLSTLLMEPTIEQLAALLKQSQPSDRHQSMVLLRKGGPKPPLFFIHDGEGETLLYRNLALGLKADRPVYGVQPYSRDGYPILHTRLEDIVKYYAKEIRQVQPQGPYLLAGLCIGGFIAFEVGRHLQNQGETVAMIALLDTVDLEAPMRRSLATQRRDNFAKALNHRQHISRAKRLVLLAKMISKKARNLIVYEVTSRVAKLQTESKMKLLRLYLDRGWSLPRLLQHIPVRMALRFAERGYVPDARYQGEILLFRATQKSSVFDGTEIDDTPYSEIYEGPLLGWERRVTQGVKLYDAPGGHSSMLQVPNVQVIAEVMQTYMDRETATDEHPTAYPALQAADCDGQLSHIATHS